VKESEIRPAALLDEYLRLSAADVEGLLDNARFVDRPCPACNSAEKIPAFIKNDFTFVRCAECFSLYANPVPTSQDLDRFYRDSVSQTYWAETFFPAVAEARREKIFAPRVDRIRSIASDAGIKTTILCDVGAGMGIFLEEARSKGFGEKFVAVEPSAKMAAHNRSLGFDVFEGFASHAGDAPGLANHADIATCFEVIEHMVDPLSLIQSISTLVRPGGLIVISGLCGTGFDILTLGADANAVSPPHHLTFVSEQGANRLVTRAGLELLKFDTPGQLDVELVRNKSQEPNTTVLSPFATYITSLASEDVQRNFQTFLAANGLSSHMWIIARKPQ
jgi:2-polyprenyl-3-methyl-5-hydroxy-6-metoxy-1,4-benzoquinol methylase